MDRTAWQEWDAHYRSGKSFHALGDEERALLRAYAPAGPGATALDVGCGIGELARHLASLGYLVDAVDYAPAAIRRAAAAGGDGVGFLHHDIESDSGAALPRAPYDLVTLRLSCPVLRDRAGTMARLRALLRPGGAVCVITPRADGMPEHQRAISLDAGEIAELARGWARFRDEDAGGLAFLLLTDARDGRPLPPS